MMASFYYHDQNAISGLYYQANYSNHDGAFRLTFLSLSSQLQLSMLGQLGLRDLRTPQGRLY